MSRIPIISPCLLTQVAKPVMAKGSMSWLMRHGRGSPGSPEPSRCRHRPSSPNAWSLRSADEDFGKGTYLFVMFMACWFETYFEELGWTIFFITQGASVICNPSYVMMMKPGDGPCGRSGWTGSLTRKAGNPLMTFTAWWLRIWYDICDNMTYDYNMSIYNNIMQSPYDYIESQKRRCLKMSEDYCIDPYIYNIHM